MTADNPAGEAIRALIGPAIEPRRLDEGEAVLRYVAATYYRGELDTETLDYVAAFVEAWGEIRAPIEYADEAAAQAAARLAQLIRGLKP